MSIQPRYAFIQIALELSQNGKVIANEIISVKKSFDDLNNATSSENIAMSAMNLALENALWQIHQTALRYR
jgi:hypothetical protein